MLSHIHACSLSPHLALFHCTATLLHFVEKGGVSSLWDDSLVAAFNSFTHISRGWCSNCDDEGITKHIDTGRGRWGTHVAPSTLLTLLWQQHVAFLCICNSYPQELWVFSYTPVVSFIYQVYQHWLCHWSTDLGVGKYGIARGGTQKLPEKGSWGSSSEPHPCCWKGKTVYWELLHWGGAAAQREWQGERVTPPAVGQGINWELGSYSSACERHSGWERRGRLAVKCPQDRKERWHY